MTQIYSNIKTSFLTLVMLLAVTVSGFAATITVSAGTTVNYTQDMSGTVIEVYGTLNYTPGNMNGSGNKVIAFSGGIVNIPTKTSLSNVLLDVRAGGVLNISATDFSMSNSGTGIKNAGTVNATSTTLTLNSGVGLENSGTFNVKVLSLGAGTPTGLLNKNTGTLNITGSFTSNADYENTASGLIKIGGSIAINNGTFINSGSMTVAGSAAINSAMTLNGTLTVAGNVVINKAVTGTNGVLTITNGISVMNTDGKFTGTNMRFNDVNTAGNDFDVNSSNFKSTNVYSKGAAPAAGPITLPLRFISFDAVEYNQNYVYFKFTTSVESNLSAMVLQGSTDGKTYANIESFTPHNINGIYNYTSAKVEAVKYSSYRIAVTNTDGTKEYSATISYRSSAAAESASSISIYPNPVVNATFNVKVTLSEPTIINIITPDGKILFNTVLKGQQLYQVNMPSNTAKFSLLIVQVIQNGTIKSFNVLNK